MTLHELFVREDAGKRRARHVAAGSAVPVARPADDMAAVSAVAAAEVTAEAAVAETAVWRMVTAYATGPRYLMCVSW